MKKYIFTLICFLFYITQTHAQISYGGTPYSLGSDFKQLPLARVALPIFTVPALDKQAILKQDRETVNSNRFAAATAVEVSIAMGLWQTLPTGERLGRLQIALQGNEAMGMRLFFDEFALPEGGRLFIYTPDNQILLGAFTEKNNKKHLAFATTLIKSNTIIIEYIEPAGKQGQTRLRINRIDQAYRQVPPIEKPKKNDKLGFGASGSCNININCSALADNWHDEQRGIVRILTVDNMGSGYCSGSLIRNTANNNKPYILTAHHCTEGTTSTNLNNWTFDFNYEIKNCSTPNTDPPNTQNITGSTMRAQYAPSDVALLELQDNVPIEFNAYYNGWDRTGDNVSGAVCIHHPSGDVKKFTLDTDANSTQSYYNDIPNDNTHFRQVWNNGTTEGGSSGSPLFTSAGKIIGQLHGGEAFCSAPNSPDWFGKFSVSWTGGDSNDTRLSNWLDPTNSGVTSLTGSDANPTANENAQQASSFRIYPNPTKALAYLAYEKTIWGGQSVEIALYHTTGKLAYQRQILLSSETNTLPLAFSNLPAGMYILRIKTAKGFYTEKLIIE